MMQKRISAPKTYKIKRKEKSWVAKPKPGPHNKKALPLSMLLRDIIGITNNEMEVKMATNNSKILIDGTVRKEKRFPVGFLDVITIPSLKKSYRITYDLLGRLVTLPIKNAESEIKIIKIINKKKKDKGFQLGTNDGRTIIITKKNINYKTKDSLIIKVPSQEIIKHLPFKEGVSCFITGGKHIGKKGILKEIKDQLATIIVDKSELKTSKDYVFVTGEKKEEVTIQ